MTKKLAYQKKKGSTWIPYILLVVIVGLGFYLRVVPSWTQIFTPIGILFRDTDSWYHMRLVENMMENFPKPLKWDFFSLYPGGSPVGYYPLMSWLIAIPGFLLGYEIVGALIAPVLGTLTLVTIFFIGKVLWNGWVGLFSSFLAAILPTEFFHKSMVGYPDHHILEVTFLTLTILFLLLSQKKKNLLYYILAGLSLGLYMGSWGGGLILGLLLSIWCTLTFLFKISRKEDTKLFSVGTTVTFLISFLIFLPHIFLVEGSVPLALFLLGISITPSFLYLLSKYFESWHMLVIVVEGLAILGITTVSVYYPQMMWSIRSVLPGFGSTIQEATPSYPEVLMAHFGISFFLALGGLFFLIKRRGNLLLILWSIFMLILVLGQRRWSYYFTINNVLLASYFLYLISGWVRSNVRIAALVVSIVFIITPTIKGTIDISKLRPEISSSWYQSSVWLKGNTEPQEGYLSLSPKPLEYGILTWWDYGNFITRLGQRAPMSNPMVQDPPIQGKFFIAQSEEEANKALEGLNVRYIMVDESMTNEKFYAIAKKSSYSSKPIELIRSKSFILTLWNSKSTTWKAVATIGDVKIFERR